MTDFELDELVLRARQDRPAPGALAAVARSLRVPFVAMPIVAGVVAPSTAVAGGLAKLGMSRLGLLGWGAGSTIAVTGVVVAVALQQPEPPVSRMPASTVAAQRAPSPPGMKPMVVEPATPAPAPVAPPQPAERRVVKDVAASWDEPELIERARKALAADPRRALTLAQEHQRRFPSGALSVERDVIALEALARTGQAAEARRRALAFEAKYPKSIHLPRVQALLSRLGSN